jgi:ABC-type Mn2+/Zn2+ transport system ATPase subunit
MEIIKELRGSKLGGHGVSHQHEAPILEVEHLWVKYDTGSVLEDLSFHLHTGERVALVGPNGAGKSTLFKVIAGVLPYSSGSVQVYGYGPTGHICIAYVPQRSQVDWTFPANVEDVVMMGRIGKMGLLRWPKRRDWDHVHQALQDVGLLELAGRQINELSGGQQQRMFIARSLAQEAELMLMDEPLSGLDLNSQEVIFEILDQLKQRSVTVIMATHDLEQAAARFDRVMLLNRRLIGIGTPQHVFQPEKLMAAYGGHLRLINASESIMAVTDSCCTDGDELS